MWCLKSATTDFLPRFRCPCQKILLDILWIQFTHRSTIWLFMLKWHFIELAISLLNCNNWWKVLQCCVLANKVVALHFYTENYMKSTRNQPSNELCPSLISRDSNEYGWRYKNNWSRSIEPLLETHKRNKWLAPKPLFGRFRSSFQNM